MEEKFGPIYWHNIATSEIYESNLATTLASIQSVYQVTQEEAKELLKHSTIDNPLKVQDEECWL